MTRSLPAVLLLALAGAAAAQQPPAAGAQVDPRQMIVAAYSLRRAGSYPAAAAAFEAALQAMPRGPEKRLVGAEAAELFKVIGRLDKALLLYRQNHDFAGEFEVLFALNRDEEALSVARLVKYPKGEADALARLGRVDEALAILAQQPALAKDRAKLLFDSHRFSEAAQAYSQLGDYFSQAKALEALGDPRGSRRAFEDAKMQVSDDLRHTFLPRLKYAEDALAKAPDGVSRERARLLLARVLGDLADQYEHLALIYARTGQPPEKCAQLAQNAKGLVQRRKDVLLDVIPGRGADQYGTRAVDYYHLDDRIADLDRQARQYAAMPAPLPGGR
jgi:tetratricopeptide (TPR) repeat protein